MAPMPGPEMACRAFESPSSLVRKAGDVFAARSSRFGTVTARRFSWLDLIFGSRPWASRGGYSMD